MGLIMYNGVPYGGMIVDSELSDTSENPVQNKVITGAIQEKYPIEYDVQISKAEYEALDSSKYTDGKNYYIYDAETDWEPTVIYGYHIDPDESDPYDCVSYIEGAIGRTPASMGTTAFSYGSWKDAFFMPRPCMVKYDGTVDYYLDPNDYTKKEDGTASDVANLAYQGNAMIEWPKIYYKFVEGSSEGEGYFYCSNKKVDNTYNCFCNIDSQNNEIDHFYTSIYNGTSVPVYSNTATYNKGDYVTYTDNTYTNGALYICKTFISTPEEFDNTKWDLVSEVSPLRSLSGFNTDASNGSGSLEGNIQEARALANNTTENVEWYIDVWADRMLINALLILISKNLNSQEAFGNGLTTGSASDRNNYITGSLNDKGLFWGNVTTHTSGVKVFGMENWWGHSQRRTAGLISSTSDTYLYKLTYNNYDGSTATSYNADGSGYITAKDKNGSNVLIPSNTIDGTKYYYWDKAVYGTYGYLPISIKTTNTASTYYADAFYSNNSNIKYLLTSGSVTGSNGPGISYLNFTATFTNSADAITANTTLKPLASLHQ